MFISNNLTDVPFESLMSKGHQYSTSVLLLIHPRVYISTEGRSEATVLLLSSRPQGDVNPRLFMNPHKKSGSLEHFKSLPICLNHAVFVLTFSDNMSKVTI